MDLKKFIKMVNAGTPFSGSMKFNEPMYAHTTFKTGGPADLWIRPRKQIFPFWTAALLMAARAEGIPVFVLGEGANILVSDRGIRGIVLDTGSWRGVGKREEREEGDAAFSIKVLSGSSAEEMTEHLAARGLSGLEFLAGMPGSVGGALWMNARCYEKSISDVLLETEILDENYNIVTLPFRAEDFSYKKSPFQTRKVLILAARFCVKFRNVRDIRKEMAEHHRDRQEKGHYRYPSAGSVFKNNHNFGAPTGKIIGDLGLRGLSHGKALVASWHGNLIVNSGGASSSDIRSLIDEVAKRVKEEKGFDLEPEILFAGEW